MNIGTHIILDLFEVQEKYFKETLCKAHYGLFDTFIQDILRENKATLLNKTVHHFNEEGAVTGLYLLSESHLSIHTWPEHHYIAIDVFTCGLSSPETIIEEIIKYFQAEKHKKINVARNVRNESQRIF